MTKLLAFDFGASSGRAILGTYEHSHLTYEEIHRFENEPVTSGGYLCWDFPTLLSEIHSALEKAGQVDSMAFDTWGVDYGLLDDQGNLLGLPVCYRDPRTQGGTDRLTTKMPLQTLYEKTGTQPMDINTLIQLSLEDLNQAKTLLFMPDLLAYSFCGNAVCERTIASTSQMVNPTTQEFSPEILDTFSIPQTLLPPMVASGTVVGEYNGIKVIAVAGHDTQSAVMAMPTTKDDVAFLSCGTWSLLGTELDQPILTAESLEMALSNEIGANGKINYLTNITGLWMIQECRRHWKSQGEVYAYSQLESMARSTTAPVATLDIDAPQFAVPGNMPQKIADFCRQTGQPVPQTIGEFSRAIYDSLAKKYASSLKKLSAVSGKSFSALHILGGGSQAQLLCELTAQYCQIPVYAGPVEATALGNLILQLVALDELPSMEAGRQLIAQTEAIVRYNPTL